MASFETPTKSDKSFSQDSSLTGTPSTIYLSSSEDDYNADSTLNTSGNESVGLANGTPSQTVPLNGSSSRGHDSDVSPTTPTTGSPRDVFAFHGVDHNKGDTSANLEPPVKRPHSPEPTTEQVKRKCEEHEEPNMSGTGNESTDSEETVSNSTAETTAADVSVAGASSEASMMHKEWPLPGDSQLPATVTKLISPSGGVIYLVGTAHFSVESQDDVSKVIQLVRPHVVTVELCKSRITLLQLDEETILREAQDLNFAKMRATIQSSGLFNGVMYLLLLSMSAHLTKELGMAPGGEFRRAMAEAGRIPGCCIHLGDRPIQVTLQRALSSLTWWQTFKLTWHIISSKPAITKEEVEKCKQRDLLEEMLAEMAGEFPALSRTFVNERDLFLAHSLALAAQPVTYSNGETAPARVVGVVGIGHVSGIVANWGKVEETDIDQIMKIPPPTLTSRVLKFGVKASAVGLVVWAAYKILPVPRVSTIPRLWK